MTETTAGDRPFLRRLLPYLAPGVIFLGLAVIIVAVAAGSYEHELLLARGNGQGGWLASVVPISIDGLLVVAEAAILWGAAYGLRGFGQLWRPYLALVVGILATIAANLFSGLASIALQRAVSLWSGLAVALVALVVMWYVGTARKLASGEPLQPDGDDVNPPLPLTLAEWLPLARARLLELDEPASEQALADRMKTKRYHVQKALAPSPSGAALAAGHPAATPAAVTPPGQPRNAPAAGSPPALPDRPPRAPGPAVAVPPMAAASQPATAARAAANGGRRA